MRMKGGLVIYKDAWYEKNNIKLLLNTPVSEIDKNKKKSSHIQGIY